MTTSALRQPQGIPTGGQFAPTAHAEPRISLAAQSTADLAALAAAETPSLSRRRTFLLAQLLMVNTQQRALACAAAAHYVLQRHPDAATLIFTVRNDHPVLLANVLDSAGRILPAMRTGDWADTVMDEVRHEPAGALAEIDGVEAAGTTLRIDIAAVVAATAGNLTAEESGLAPSAGPVRSAA